MVALDANFRKLEESAVVQAFDRWGRGGINDLIVQAENGGMEVGARDGG